MVQMNDEKELVQKLKDALRRYGADYGFVVTDKSVRKLVDDSIYEMFDLKGCSPKKLVEAFMEVGKVIEQSDDGTEYVAAVCAGIAHMTSRSLWQKRAKTKSSLWPLQMKELIKQNTAKSRD